MQGNSLVFSELSGRNVTQDLLYSYRVRPAPVGRSRYHRWIDGRLPAGEESQRRLVKVILLIEGGDCEGGI